MRLALPLAPLLRPICIGSAAAACLALPLLAPGAARADEVWLKNGAQITGKATESGGEVVIAVKGGILRVSAATVDRIDRAPLPDELFAVRAATTDLEDPVAARALAAYARQLGMTEAAGKIERTADEIHLETRLAQIDPKDAMSLRGLAWWARTRGLGRPVQRYLLSRAERADPSDPETHRAIAALEQEEAAEAQRLLEEEQRAARERAEEERRALEAEVARAHAEAERLRAEAEAERERRIAAERARNPPPEAWRGSGREVYGPTITVVRRGRRGTAYVVGGEPPPAPQGQPRQ